MVARCVALVALTMAAGCYYRVDPCEAGTVLPETGLPMRCDVSTTFEAGGESLSGLTAALASRLSKATGRPDVEVAAGGIPVVYEEDLVSDDGDDRPACGQTVMAEWHRPDGRMGKRVAQMIKIDPTPPVGCRDDQETIVHEGIHALCPECKHTDGGIFALVANRTSSIDEGSLTRLCEGFECDAFVPEE